MAWTVPIAEVTPGCRTLKEKIYPQHFFTLKPLPRLHFTHFAYPILWISSFFYHKYRHDLCGKFQPMMTENQLKAHDLFFQTDLNQQQIADLIGVNRKTLYGWIKQGKWLRARHVANYTPTVLVGQYYEQLGALNNRIASRDEPIPTKDEADIMRKISITIEKIKNDKMHVCDIINVFEDFTNTLLRKDLDLTQQLMQHMDEYVHDHMDDCDIDKIARLDMELEREYQQWVNSHPSPESSGEERTKEKQPTVNCQLPTETLLPTENCASESRVQNRVYPKDSYLHKSLHINDLHQQQDKKLSTNKNKKQGVAPAPQNRRERRLQQRNLKTKGNNNKRK